MQKGPCLSETQQKNLHLRLKFRQSQMQLIRLKAHEIKKNLDGCEILSKEALKRAPPLTPPTNPITNLSVKIPLFQLMVKRMVSTNGMNFLKLKLKSVPFFISSLVLTFGLGAEAQQLVSASQKVTPPTDNFTTICWHDVTNGNPGNAFSVRKKDLIEQFDYLRANYNVVSLKDIVDASQGKKTLPPKAVLLTFDDGLDSFYENVYPLLKSYKFKAVFAIVGKWTEDGVTPDYGVKDSVPKTANWNQLKEMSDSGFVDIVSHTYDMHQGQVFNPQGSEAAMAAFFKYDAQKKSYQSEEDFTARALADLKKNNELIKKHLGKDNNVIVWPYGASNSLSRKAAEEAGLTIQMSLRTGLNSVHDLAHIRRGLMFSDMDINQFAQSLKQAFVDQSPLRMIRVDIDSLWKKTEAETEQNLGDLLDNTLALGANGVLLQALSDTGEAYFATSAVKMRGDYLNRVGHSMRYRANVPYVYARLPQSFLKDTSIATAAIRDLAKYTDIDGIFFDMRTKEKSKDVTIPFETFMAAARTVRPNWQFGLIGQKPVDASLFNYVVVAAKDVEKEKALQADSEYRPAKVVVALPQDYKSDVPTLTTQGYLNLFYDVNFNGFTPDAEFKSLFSVRQSTLKQNKAETK